MKKIYHFNYDYGVAEVTIAVDTDILTEEPACAILDFYGWYYDKETDRIGEVVKMCAIEVIRAGVLFGNNLPAIKKYIKENNELDLLDDKSGIKIIDFKPFQFEEVFLDIEDLDSEDIEDIEE